MKTSVKKILFLTSLATCICHLSAQDPPTNPEPKSEPKPELRLTGEWELYQGDSPTGLLLDLRQITNRVHGIYGDVKPSDKLGISKGTEFFRATITENTAEGQIILRNINKETKELETRTNPFRFKILNEGDQLDCEIGGEKVKKGQEKFTLRRSAKVKNFRLIVKTADGWQPAGKIVENMPMAIEAELSNSTKKTFPFTVKNGEKSIKLSATYLAPENLEHSTVNHIARTQLFLPTFGNQLGVPENPKKPKEEEFGREPNDEDWKTLNGVWRAGYIDKEIGEINGWIDINHPVKKSFNYQDPETEYWRELELVKAGIIESTDPAIPRKWKFKLDGWGVTSEKIEPTPKEDLIELLLNPNVIPVKITHENLAADVEIERSDLADYSTLYLELVNQKDQNLLVFDWRYTANRETNRDRNGLGRVGNIEVTDPHSTVGTMTGREAWMKNIPNIIATFCTDDQRGLEEVAFYDKPELYSKNIPRFRYGNIPEIRKNNGSLVQQGVPPHKGTRKIFIIATDFPADLEKRIVITPDKDSDIDYYQVIAHGTEKESARDENLKSAWAMYRSSIPDPGTVAGKPVAQLENLSQSKPYGILVKATLKKDAEPGLQKLTMNDVPSAWKLEFGDTIASPQWIRQVASNLDDQATEWEPISIAFRPEVIRLSLKAAAVIKSEETVFASILVNKYRLPIPEGGSGEGKETNYKIPLTPDPLEPDRYLSPPIHLISESLLNTAKSKHPDHLFIVCNQDDLITAEFQSQTLYTISPKTTAITVKTTPDNMNALWKLAVKKAADVEGITIDDFDAITNEKATEVTNRIITNFFVPGNSVKQKTEIHLGDHAAMLLLRDTFVEMMNEQLADWRKNQSPGKIKSIFQAHKADIAGRRSPLSYYKIPLQNLNQFNGTEHDDEVYLFTIFDEFEMQHNYKFTGVMEDLRFTAFSYAWKNYGHDMLKTINDAKNLADADINGLLKLTGYSFQPVVNRLLPRLMKLEGDAASQTQQWVPDKLARAYVKSLETLGGAVKAQADYSKAASNYVLTLVSIATIPFGNVGGFWTALAVGGIAATDLAHTVYYDVYQQWDMDGQIKDEVARGAVLGAERAAERKSEKLATWQKALSVGGSALGGLTDGAAVLKALRGAKSAKVLEAGAEILKRADFADPKVLRSLSIGDQAVLKRIADETAELMRRGEITELTELQRKALDQAEELDIIFKNEALKQIEKFSPDELAVKANDIAKKSDLSDATALKNLDEADLATLRKARDEAAKLQKAGKAEELTDLQKSVLNNSKNIDDAYDATPKGALQKEIADRFATASKPISTKVLEETATNLTQKAKELNDIGKATRKNLNTTKKAYEQARDAAKKSPTDQARKAVEQTGKAYREAKKSSELVNDLAGDVTQRAQAANNMLEQAKQGKTVRTTKADDRLLTLNNGKTDLNNFINKQKSNPTATFTKQERDMMRELSGFKKSDVKAVEDLIKANGGDWEDISKLANGSGNDMLNMHRISAYRRLKMNKLADEAISETKTFLKNSGIDEADMVMLERNAFGSANLTSDYDVAIKGTGAELVVQNFNQKVRKLFRGTESGAVVDTNLYTDPIYNIFKQSDMTGKLGGLSAQEVDKARQFVFLQMANAKHRIMGNVNDVASMVQWEKYKNNILKGVPPEARSAMADMMDQAVKARSLAETRIAEKMTDVADSATKVGDNVKLRATNELYGETLTDIHHYRRMLEDIEQVKNGKKNIRDIDLPPALHDPKFANQINEIEKLLGNDATKARGLQELDEISRQAAINIRSKQGEALYYASEAYQTRGTIGHVVDELQAGGQAVTLDSLKAGRNTQAVKDSVLKTDDYINSYYENGGMLIKELNGKKVLDNAGNLKSGLDPKYYNKAAQKVAKYFERQLDAAAKSGVDMAKLFKDNPNLEKIADATIQLNKVRSDPTKFNEAVQKLFGDAGNAEQEFVKQAIDFNNMLESKVITNSEILGYANKLADTEKAITKSAVNYGKTWEPYTSLGGKSMQSARAVSDTLANENENFERNHSDDLQFLSAKQKSNEPFTTEETKQLRSLQQNFTSMKELNTQAAAARTAGVAPEEIDRVINQAKQSSPENWQKPAADQMNQLLKQKISTTPTTPMGKAEISPMLSNQLGLKNSSMQTTSPQDLAHAIKSSGKFIHQSDIPLKLNQLATQAEAGRLPIIMMRDADNKPTWQQLQGVTTDSAGRKLVHIRDSSTGSVITMPEALFSIQSQNIEHQIIIDPFCSADGTIMLDERNSTSSSN